MPCCATSLTAKLASVQQERPGIAGAAICVQCHGARQDAVHVSVLACLQAERHALEACVLEMAGKSAALERWLADNEKKAVTGERSKSGSTVLV